MIELRILQIIHGYPMRFNAGSEVYTQTLCQALIKLNHEVAVFTREEDPFKPDYTLIMEEDVVDQKSKNPKKIQLFLVNVARQKDRYQSKELDNLLIEVLNHFNPDIVHIQHLNHLSLSLVNVCHQSTLPIIYTLHDYWLICPRGQFLRINYGGKIPWMLCDSQHDNNCALHCYSRYFTGLKHFKEKDLEYWSKWVEARQNYIKSFVPYVNLFIAPSRFLMNRIQKELNIPDSKLLYLDYGFDYQRLTGRNREQEQKTVFGYIGTHIAAKGLHHLIKAFSMLKVPAILRIWGRHRGEATPCLQSLITQLNLPKYLSIEWYNEYRNPEIIQEVFNNTDVIVVPSIWDENSPLVIHEALQARVPVITANQGGMAEYVHHKINGLLFEHRNIKSLAAQMEYFVENADEVLKIAQRGYIQSSDGNVISATQHGKKIAGIYESLRER